MELYHVLSSAAWAEACRLGQYAPAQLAQDGFLHCCCPEQLDFVLAKHFPAATNMLVLTFDATALAGALRWVQSEPDMPPFPHLYSAIPCSSVRAATPVGCVLPAGLDGNGE
jgi:uncharacterized protein (DUF952 family)